jgi:hypothetical protein
MASGWTTVNRPMPAKDRDHDAAKSALIKDGWTIESEQVGLTIGERNLWIDIQAIKSENSQLVVLIEVKELAAVNSPIEAFAKALGKFELYRLALLHVGNDLPLFMAVSVQSFEGILSEPLGQLVLKHIHIPLIVFNQEREEIVQWIP